jgi:hypothetical protein
MEGDCIAANIKQHGKLKQVPAANKYTQLACKVKDKASFLVLVLPEPI